MWRGFWVFVKMDHLLLNRALTRRASEGPKRCLSPAKKRFPPDAKVNLVDATLLLVHLPDVVRHSGVEADAPAGGTHKPPNY
jgi:hypothetical protein